MKIGKKYKVESDSLNITLYKRAIHRKTRMEYWTVIGYYPNVKSALKGLVDLELDESKLTDLKTVVAKQEEIYRLIDGLKTATTSPEKPTREAE